MEQPTISTMESLEAVKVVYSLAAMSIYLLASILNAVEAVLTMAKTEKVNF